MTAHFRLVQRAGRPDAAQVLLVLENGTSIANVGIDLLRLARNDPGAFRYPLGSGVDKEAAAKLSARLLAPLRMLTRGRVVPLAADLEF